MIQCKFGALENTNLVNGQIRMAKIFWTVKIIMSTYRYSRMFEGLDFIFAKYSTYKIVVQSCTSIFEMTKR